MINPAQISVGIKTTAIDAMKIIDSSSAQIALVVDGEGKLEGTLTDGDIRRGLLFGKKLTTTVDQLMNRNYRYVQLPCDNHKIMSLMIDEKLSHIPALDEHGRVASIHVMHDLLKKTELTNPVVIMAGGKGKRLRPYTENCPKPMLPVDGKPILEILLEQCIEKGFKNFYFSVNYLKEQIVDYFGDGSNWRVSINYLVEDKPLGTAGSLKLLPADLDQSFLVLNGDVLTQLDASRLLAFHKQNKSDATLCVREHIVTIPFGVVEANGIELMKLKEKPSVSVMVNAGIYVLDPRLLPLIPRDTFLDMPELLEIGQQNSYKVSVCPVHEYWIDVGRPETLEQADREWSCDLK